MEMWLRALHKLPNSLWNSYPPSPSEHLHTNDASKCFSSIYSYVLCSLSLSPSLPLAHLLPWVFHMDAIFIDPTRHSSTD